MAGFSVCFLTSLWAAVGGAGEVTYVHRDGVYLDRGRTAGLAPGVQVEVVHRGHVVANLEVVGAADHSSFARVVDAQRAVRPGMRARFSGAESAAPTPMRPAAVTMPVVKWQPPTFTPVTFSGRREAVALRRVRSSAHLRGSTWVYLDSDDNAVTHRDRLHLVASGPLDGAGRFWVDADVTVTGRPATPDDGVRLRADESIWIEVFRAELAYRRAGWTVGVGRTGASRLRWGRLDGASLAYTSEGGLRLRLAAGGRPEAISLAPGFERLAAVADVSGNVDLGGGLFTYAWSGSWLGNDGRTEAAEASAQLGLAFAGRWWLQADAGTVLLLPPDRDPRGVVDRAAVSVAYTFLESFAARVSLRRWQDANLPSERGALPAGYLRTRPTYAAVASVDGLISRWRGLALHGRVVSGGGLGEDDRRRLWAAPSLTFTMPAWRRLRLRLGYRLELGWIGGHHAEGLIGVEPVDGVRVDLLQQGGVLTLTDTNEAMPTFSTWLRVSAELLAWLRLGVRARGHYGEAGSGVEAGVWLVARDFM